MASKRVVFFCVNICLFVYNFLFFITLQTRREQTQSQMNRIQNSKATESVLAANCDHCKMRVTNCSFDKFQIRTDVNLRSRLHHPSSKKKTYIKSPFTLKGTHIDLLSLRNKQGIDCKAIISGEKHEEKRANAMMKKNHKVPTLERQYETLTKNCSDFKRSRRYILTPVTREEEEFPLAFSIAMYKDIEQVERLLRAVYQPHNLYCIHVDLKSSLILHRTVQSIASCFDNVFIASRLDTVNWGDSSVLSPVINCMHDLVTYFKGRWKYFINLTGQEFPLRTNYELVRIAKVFNGSNDITGSLRRAEPQRTKFRWKYRWSKTYKQILFYNTFLPKSSVPHNADIYKGEVHGLFSQRFVEYIVKDERAKEFLRWCEDSGHASEHYFNTLNYNIHLQAPGGFIGTIEEAESYSYHDISRAKHWNEFLSRQCSGQYVRGICVFGLGDLPWLATRRQLFANKFYLIDQYSTLDCLEELHRNKTLLGSDVSFDETMYHQLPTVQFSRKNGLYT